MALGKRNMILSLSSQNRNADALSGIHINTLNQHEDYETEEIANVLRDITNDVNAAFNNELYDMPNVDCQTPGINKI